MESSHDFSTLPEGGVGETNCDTVREDQATAPAESPARAGLPQEAVTLQIAAVQMDPKLADVDQNLKRCLEMLGEARRLGAKLAVFPECALTGYCFSNLHEVRTVAEPVPGPSTWSLAQTCRELDLWAVIGLIELADGKCYNSATLIGPGGIVGVYRKTHLPFLGGDRFLSPGDGPLVPWSTAPGRLGLLICYDLRFPEAVRALALQGSELIVLPTNWPVGAESNPSIFGPARAAENRVFLVAANRVGIERGTTFIGRSQIVDVTGNVIVEGSADREEIICATLDLALAQRKHIVNRPGEYELDVMNDRRPDLYGLLTAPSSADSKPAARLDQR